MTELRLLLAFLAVCAFALVFASCGVKSALAPFCALSSIILWLSAFGMLGQLRLGGWLLYGAAALCVGLLIWRHGLQKKPLPALGFGFWFFVGASLLVCLILWAKQPLFIYWDEFSFWGTAGKVTKLADELYTTAEVGWRVANTQKPGLIVLTYFFQFFGTGFAEWQTYAAYDIFMLAGLACVLACFDDKKDWNAALPMMLVLVLVPFAFRHGIATDRISNVWLDSTAELPMACAFGGVLCSWLGGGQRRRLRGMVLVCLGLGALVLLKDAALTFALVAAVLVGCDALVADDGEKPRPGRRLGGAALRLGLGLGCVVLVFAGWEGYAAALAGPGAVSTSEASRTGMLGLPALFVRDLFSPEKGEIFTTVTRGMRDYFFARSNMFGSGFTVVLGILALLGLAFVLAGKGQALRRRCLVFGVFSTLGFAAYYLFITLTYLYILSPAEARLLASYDRYIYPFYMAWFMAALLLFGQSVAGLPVVRAKLAAAGKGVVLVLGLALLLRTGQLVPVYYNILGVQPEDYNERREFIRHTEWLQTQLDPGGKTFMVLSEDGGLGIFQYVHDMLPWQLDYSYGGTEKLQEKRAAPGGGTEVVEITAEELSAHLAESGCTTLYIDSINDRFRTLYGGLFSDGLEGYDSGTTRLYAVRAAGGTARLEPLPMAEME